MRPLRFLRQRPVALFAVAVCAFVVWVARETGDAPNDTPPPNTPRMLPLPPPLVAEADGGELAPRTRLLPQPPAPAKAKPTPQATAQALPKLKPGMTRTEVEELVGAPDSVDLRPATVADGRVTYHMAYEADLGPPQTVRPIPPMGHRPAPKASPRRLVTLEFDATKPGHPLVGIHYPEPAF